MSSNCKEMKITLSLINKLIRLKNGESLPSSSLKGDWIEAWLKEGILVSRSTGSRRVILAPRPDVIELSISHYDERFRNLEQLKTIYENNSSRGEQAADTGNSKYRKIRSCPGFLVNSYDEIPCRLNGKDFIVSPAEGSFVYIADWESFEIPLGTTVVGIENPENFRQIIRQRKMFEKEIRGAASLLFVSRYPQSSDLSQWLQKIPNRYVHFGDFDLAGIHIFLTEFYRHIPDRASFLIPADIERRLELGSFERYTDQYHYFKNLFSDIPNLQNLIDLINRYHKGYDQEGYIYKNFFAD